jgi:orotidine-5'-phosphate decarboxylase
VNAGANYLVIGRPITAAPDPQQALQQVIDSLGKP